MSSKRYSPASSRKISALFDIRPTFLRSVNVALDYGDPSSSENYIVTDFVREVMARLAAGLRQKSNERAWRITGDYGSGKSAFALAFSRIAAKRREQLPKLLHPFVGKDVTLEPVLVSGAPESLEQSIRKGLADLRDRRQLRASKSLETESGGHDGLIRSLDAHADMLRKAKLADGLVLILDELGQNLQHAVLHPSDGDVSLLQRLGEKADRSGLEPFIVVALLHQGINAYAADLDTTAKREWEKVSGRYKEVVFAHPLEQVATLVAEMLGVQFADLSDPIRKDMRVDMEAAVDCGLYGAAASKAFLTALAYRFYPLHPTVFPVLIRLLRRFGQNERSLVGFLSSYEEFGFREFADTTAVEQGLYRLPNLYDYFKANLAASLYNGHASHFEVIDGAVSHATALGETAVAAVKIIGLINLLNDPSLVATDAMVRLSIGQADAVSALKALRSSASLVHTRGSSQGLSLWPHTSVNLDNAFDQAEDALSGKTLGAKAIAAHLPTHNVVARRHYIETGNLRHFAVSYIDVPTLKGCLAGKFPPPPGADGQVFVVLPDDAAEEKTALALLSDSYKKLDALTLVGVSTPLAGVGGAIRDLKRWEWIKANLKELAGDVYARNHVNREVKRCEHRIEKGLQHLLLLRDRADSAAKVMWFDVGGSVKTSTTKGLLPHLSHRCDKVFQQCPHVPNELINRRVTSAAASKARSALIEAIAAHGNKENLAFDPEKSPPEFAIYLSVLKAGRLHFKDGASWRIASIEELGKNDPLKLAPSLAKIHSLLANADTQRRTATELFAALRDAPFGVKDGLLPLLLAVYLAGQWDQTALYEDGTFIEKPGADVFQRLAKEPEAFDFQHCSVRGVRRELFSQVASILGVTDVKRPDVLAIVRPLMIFAARLPEYAVHTERSVKPATRKMRAALLPSREPATLLFRELPKALGFEPFAADKVATGKSEPSAFAEALHAAILDLREAYPRLLQRVRESLLAAFHWSGSTTEFREQFNIRQKAVAQTITEPELRVFASRVADANLHDREWTESIATYVTRKTPDLWRDNDEDDFHNRLSGLAARFQRAEAAGFNGKAVDPERARRAVRFTLTRPDGSEVDHVIHWTSRDETSIEEGKSQLRSLVQRLGPAGMAAAAEFVWESLQQKKP